MIGGRVLDASALLAFASGTSIYAQALVWTAVEADIVLAVPSTALAMAWARIPDKDHDVLDVLMQLYVIVVDDLTVERARAVGMLGGDQVDAHAMLCASDRAWPLVTTDPRRYAALHSAAVDIEPLP